MSIYNFNTEMLIYLLLIFSAIISCIILVVFFIILFRKFDKMDKNIKSIKDDFNSLNNNLNIINDDINKVNNTIDNSITPFIETNLKISMLKTIIGAYKKNKADRKAILKQAIKNYQKITALKK